MTVETLPKGALDLALALAPYNAATVHEAYDRRGAMSPDIKPIVSGLKLCAPVMTARTMPGNNLIVHQALYQTPPGWALAIATGGDRTFGYWGELLTTAAIAQRVAGLVIEGAVRDVAELRTTGFPLFAGGVSMRGTTKLPEGDLGITISLAGVDLSPGDILVGDDDGVVRVRLADVQSVAQRAADRVAHERATRAALLAGATTLDLYGWPAARDRRSDE
jgi:4-hydroxy-4-methyl-2-oxoglutarate aldolase